MGPANTAAERRSALDFSLHGIPEATGLDLTHEPNAAKLVSDDVEPGQYGRHDHIVWRNELPIRIDEQIDAACSRFVALMQLLSNDSFRRVGRGESAPKEFGTSRVQFGNHGIGQANQLKGDRSLHSVGTQ